MASLISSLSSAVNTAKSAAGAAAGAATTAKAATTGLTDLTTDASAGAKSVQSFFSTYGMYIVGGIVLLIGIILLILWALGYLTPKKPNKNATAALTSAAANAPALKAATKEGFQAQAPTVAPQAISPEETTFMNVQPLTIKDAGFEGPYPAGLFDAEGATASALKAGFRSLILQIDYMDSQKDTNLFPAPNEPTLLVRAANGSLLSTNAGSIKEVAQTIANMAFRPEVPNNIQPVVLYLHINRAPNPISDPNTYLLFLSKIATALNPLAPTHLGLTPHGNFTRQKSENILLATPLASIQGQVVILSNADTSLFRKTSTSITKYNPAQDLDFWVNMRVYLDSEDDLFGITQLPAPGVVPSAILVNLDRVLALSSTKKNAFAAKAQKQYVIAMGPRTANPTVAQVDTAINSLGINCVPLDIFSESTSTIMELTGEYANMSYHPKPVALRNVS